MDFIDNMHLAEMTESRIELIHLEKDSPGTMF